MMISDSLSPFEYFSQHLQIIGWPTLCFAVWKVTRFMTTVETRVVGSETHITAMATNHFPHMEASLANQDTLLKSVDQSLKTLVSNDAPSRPRKARRTPRRA
jgi:hypothetical protein